MWKCVNISIGPYQIRKGNVHDYLYLKNGSFKFEVHPHQFNLHYFSQFLFDVKNKSKNWKNHFYASHKTAHRDSDMATQWRRAGLFSILIFKKLEGLWLAGEVVNVWTYGSKAAEGCSAFQRWSCYNKSTLVLIITPNRICNKFAILDYHSLNPNNDLIWATHLRASCL